MSAKKAIITFLISLIQQLFSKKKPVNPFPTARHYIKAEFKHKGIQYYSFGEDFNMPTQRAFSALDVYAELEQRITKDYLTTYIEAVFASANKGDLVRIAGLTENLKTRMDNVVDVDVLYKLASVLYFDETENPYIYDASKGREKIKIWKEDKNIADFFLQMPIHALIPSNLLHPNSLATYTTIQRNQLKQMLNQHLDSLPKNEKESELSDSLRIQIQELTNILTYTS